jgi:O-antigen/teichoic acid export membrane protein
MIKLLSDPLYKGSLFIFLSQVVSSGLGFVFWMVASNYYAQDEIGYATAIMSSLSLLILLSRLGLDQSIIRFFPNHDKGAIFTTALVITTSAVFILSLFYVLFAKTWSSGFQMIYDFPLVFLVLAVITSVISIFSSVFIALRRSEYYLLENLLIGLRIPLLIPLVVTGLVGILISTAVASAIALVALIPALINEGIRLRKFDSKFIKESFNFSFFNYFSILLASAPGLLLPIIVLIILGAEEAAIYYIAFAIASVIFLIPNAIGISLFVEGSHDRPLLITVAKTFIIAIVVLVPAVILIALGGSWILSLFGPEYVSGSYLLSIMALSSFFYLVFQLYISVLNVQKKLKTLIIFSGIQFALLIVLSYVLSLIFGLSGVGYAWLASSILMAFLIAIMIRKNIRDLLGVVIHIKVRDLI